MLKKPVVLPDILYDLDKYDLKPQFQDSLQGLIATLDANENIVIELASFTDSRGSDERNDILDSMSEYNFKGEIKKVDNTIVVDPIEANTKKYNL